MARKSFPFGLLAAAGSGGLAAGLLAWRALSRRTHGPPAIPYVDSRRILGTWFEVARYPSLFEATSVAPSVTAELGAKGTFRVVYRCRRNALEGRSWERRGRATLLDPIGNSELRVTLFWPLSMDVRVIDVAPDYSWAVLGDRRRRHLWILSRTPQLDSPALDEILDRLPRQGYDPGRLEWPAQPPAAGSARLPAMGQAPLH